MISNEMLQLGTKRSVIREIFEYGKIRAGEIGAENVYDFSLGNPNVPAPECVKEALLELLNSNDSNVLHSYTSAQGDAGVRKTIADSINERFGTNVTANHIYMTVGAAASLCICAKALTMPGDEFITFAPFFPEYRVFVESVGAKLKVVPVNTDNFQIDFKSFKALLSPNTKAIIMNSPNNPSGVVYSEETVKELCSILEEKSKEYNHPIYLISDEPYREIVYDNIKVPYLMNYYKILWYATLTANLFLYLVKELVTLPYQIKWKMGAICTLLSVVQVEPLVMCVHLACSNLLFKNALVLLLILMLIRKIEIFFIMALLSLVMIVFAQMAPSTSL